MDQLEDTGRGRAGRRPGRVPAEAGAARPGEGGRQAHARRPLGTHGKRADGSNHRVMGAGGQVRVEIGKKKGKGQRERQREM